MYALALAQSDVRAAMYIVALAVPSWQGDQIWNGSLSLRRFSEIVWLEKFLRDDTRVAKVALLEASVAPTDGPCVEVPAGAFS